jgi:hypothetical protein
MNKKIDVITSVLGNYHHAGSECLFSCPYCKHHRRKLSINVERNVYKCWICDTRGKDIFRIIRRFGTFKEQERWKELSNTRYDLTDFDDLFGIQHTQPLASETIVDIPEGFHTLTGTPSSPTEKRIINYLDSRGVGKSDIIKWKIGYTTQGRYRNRVVIPSFNENGDLNYFVARAFGDQYMRYLNPPVSRNIIFNELYVDFSEEVVLVEGVFDAIKAHNSVPILGSSIRETSKLFQKIVKHDTPVLLALDPDARNKSNIIKNLLLKYAIEVRELKYPSDLQDLGDLSHSEVEHLTQLAPFVTPSDKLLNAIEMI